MNLLESRAIECDSHVKKYILNIICYLSKTVLVKDCLNLPASSGKTKYYQETDSELVPWGKGEKYSE